MPEDLTKLPYRWTDRDAQAVARAVKQTHDADDRLYRFVTPYRIPPLAPEGAPAWKKGQQVTISLAQSGEMWSVARFFKDGYDWQEIPGDLREVTTLEDLSAALFERDPVRWAPHDLSKMSAQQKSDFCLLHFELWRNTDYRYAVTEIRAGGDPGLASGFDYTLLKAQANTLPAQAKGGPKIGWALGKPPKIEPPIKPPPIPKPKGGDKPTGPKSIVVTPLRPEIELDSWRKQIIEPMWIDGTDFLASRLKLKVTLDGPSEKTTLQIRKNGEVYYEETYDKGPFLEKGTHAWEWDGFSAEGILDIEGLKRNRWSARVLVVDKAGRTAFGSVTLTVSKAGMPWVDVVVKRAEKLIEVTVYTVYVNMRDVKSLDLIVPPARVPIPLTPPPEMHLDPTLFDSYRKNIIAGIARYWSREGMSLAGDTWTVKVVAKEREKDAIKTILGQGLTPAQIRSLFYGHPILGYLAEENGVGRRSFNLATLQEGQPVVDLYLTGESDDSQQYTGAHEVGHSVLRERGGVEFSMTHKGSSSVGQEPSPGTRVPPAPAEIDVMLYFKIMAGFSYDRVKAVEEDVRALISLAKVTVT